MKYNFVENRLATLVRGLLGNVGPLSVFVLCCIMFMPSLAQLGFTECKQLEQIIFKSFFFENGLATLNYCTNQDRSRGPELALSRPFERRLKRSSTPCSS